MAYGAVTLTAMLLVLGESAWASLCAADMGVWVSAEAMPNARSMPHAHDCGGHHDAERSPSQPESCPLGPMSAAQGCLAAASLPAPAPVAPAGLLGEAAGVAAAEQHPDPLFDTTLFHPPRA